MFYLQYIVWVFNLQRVTYKELHLKGNVDISNQSYSHSDMNFYHRISVYGKSVQCSILLVNA